MLRKLIVRNAKIDFSANRNKEVTKYGVRGDKGDVAEKAKNDDRIAEKAKADNGNKVVISLFVENLPEKLHWKGLWFSFARHGDVVSVYIAKKKSRGGKRFGFVRMKNLVEATRVMERLDGFTLYGSRLSVKRAKENVEWERKRVLKPSVYKTGPPWSDKREEHIDGGFPGGSCQVCIGSMEEKLRIKRISGHVESEDLWRLRRCLVGATETICSASSIHQRLADWGLGEINVQRLGAKDFLLTIEDEKLFLMLEDVNWSYLKEIFKEVVPWSEKVSYCERATWIEVRGLPLHSWNSITLKKIAGLWGTFEGIGANLKHNLDCERVSVLIATKTQRKIEEVIEVEIGDIMFQVSVREVGFNDGTSYPLCNNGTKYMSESSDESTGGSKSDSGKRGDQESSDRSRPSLEEEAFQLRCKERDSINKGYRDEETIMGQNKDSELMGGEPNISSFTSDEGLEKGGDMEAVDLKEINEVNGNVCIDSFQEVSGGELGLDVGHLPMVGPELNRKEVDLVDTTKVELDLGKEVIKDGGFCVSPLVKNLTWADKVKLNAGNDGLRDSPEVGVSDVVLEGGIVEKCEDFKVRRRKGKGRKFGSLLDLQNQSISDTERKRRDIALKKKNWSKESLEETELSGKSLSDSDINNRVSRIIKEAK
ncbi:hypothetical protein V6N13_149392 [Hibiscus sabdariffa]